MLKKRLLSLAVAALAVCAFAATSVSQASAAYMKEAGVLPGFLAVYGFPAAVNEVERPVGGGLTRGFGFGENLLFRADTLAEVGKNLSITLEKEAKVVGMSEAKDSYLGATLLSNRTGVNNPLGVGIQFVDFQDNEALNEKGEKVPAPSYADTWDRPWIAAICSAVAATKCKTDAQFAPTGEGGVEIENVSFDIGPGTVVQGTAWGKFHPGTTAKPPCISLEKAPAAAPTLVETQGSSVGATASKVEGEACLISANNNYYKVSGSITKTPAIEITNE
jgi:hypothetical protein